MTVGFGLPWPTVPHMVMANAEAFGEREALVDLDQDRRFTFSVLRDEMLTVAAAAVSFGIEHGARVALWGPNGARWALASLGLQAAGAIVVPLNPRLRGPEAAEALRQSDAIALFTVEGFRGESYVAMVRGADPSVAALDRIVIMEGEPVEGATTWSEFVARGDGCRDLQEPAPAATPDDPLIIMFTSGTTGRSKGVVMTHRQMLGTYWHSGERFGVDEGDRGLIVPPMYHSLGYGGGLLSCLSRGATAVLVGDYDREATIRYLDRERITYLPAPPTLLYDVLDHPKRADYQLDRLSSVLVASTTIPAELIRRLRSELDGPRVTTAYGLTEAPVVTLTGPDDDPEDIATTAGRAVPWMEIRCVASDGQVQAPGVAGEIEVRGDSTAATYYGDSEAWEALFAPGGWLRTGDVGLLDERGYLTVTDRLKDMVIVGGFNVYPAEVERALREHPEIAEAAVVGVPDERLGEVCLAYVVPKQEASIVPDELIAWSRERMANFKAPRRVVVTDRLPRTPTLKVHKAALREMARTAVGRASG